MGPGLAPVSRDAQLVFADLRGQGRSGRPPVQTCTLEQMADDVAELCGRLGIVMPIVFGHSAGGFVALHLALRHPGSVGGLILCDSAPTLAPLPMTTRRRAWRNAPPPKQPRSRSAYSAATSPPRPSTPSDGPSPPSTPARPTPTCPARSCRSAASHPRSPDTSSAR
ncbi:MAG TPA: alpha/beta hydrolase [Streptosporangiaceae bacterium]